MMSTANTKVTASHLKRDAFLYVRQSTVRQVFENQESTKRQYALRERAVALGWPIERVNVIDSDLGQSGASAVDREGFQRLVAEVGLGKAGIVLGLEVSRLARNSSDWHRLLEICALSETLILDEDGIYDPSDFNDRLLLGLKGTMSEAELHVLRARLRGGIVNKARRGELQGPLPVGFLYDEKGRVILDPDVQVQQSLRHFFGTFRRLGAARATVKALRAEKVLMPRRLRGGLRRGDLVWCPLDHWRALQLLHNPRYAGAFFFGRHRWRKLADGTVKGETLPRDQWISFLPGAHEGYITWEEFEQNQHQLLEQAQGHGKDRRRSPPREGPSLLQGMVVCGKCGARMTVRYHQRRAALYPTYVCQREGIDRGTPICQDVPGAGIDDAVGATLVAMVSPAALEVALAVQQELAGRIEEADRLRHNQVERARYEADAARRRFIKVDPDNRLVADALEAEWNGRLRELAAAQEEYERKRIADRKIIDDEQRKQVLALATDFPRLWRDPKTSMRERKRMARLLIEDVTLGRGDAIAVNLRFKGGATKTLSLPLPKCSWELRQTSAEVIAQIDRLLDSHTDGAVAQILNQNGHRSGEGLPFHNRIILRLRRDHGLKSRSERLHDKGMLSLSEAAAKLRVAPSTVKLWRSAGLITSEVANDKGEHLYLIPVEGAPTKKQGSKLSRRLLAKPVPVESSEGGAV